MDNLGVIIRKLREEKELPLWTVAAYLDIDQAILSRIERGQRKPTRDQVVKLAKYFKVNENDLLVAWLSDKLVYEVADEQNALKALQVAEEKVKYQNTKRGLFFLENIIFYSTYNYNVYYILKKNNNFALHENIISLIHPLITISTIILLLSIITKKNNKEKILKVYYMITLSLFLGSI